MALLQPVMYSYYHGSYFYRQKESSVDTNLWKQIVDKAILKTISRDLVWSKSDPGTSGARSFETLIDNSTTLSVRGHVSKYSYELCLTKQTLGEPFEERIQVTTKSRAEGIDFKGLFQAVQNQARIVVCERAFNAVLDFLNNPTVLDPETEEVVFPDNERERSADLNAMVGLFSYSQDEEILAHVRDLTAAGSISWTFSKPDDGDEQFFSADVGDSTEDGFCSLGLSFRVIPSNSKTVRKVTYNFTLQHEPSFWIDVYIKPTNKRAKESWILASEIHSIVSRQVRNEDEEFKKIVRDNIMQEILASLDDSHK